VRWRLKNHRAGPIGLSTGVGQRTSGSRSGGEIPNSRWSGIDDAMERKNSSKETWQRDT